MNHETVLQTFALNNQGVTVHVNDVARGAACDCICPACGAPVIARQGDVRGWHFAHQAGADCPGAVESALHKAAKEVVRRARGIELPPLMVSRTHRRADGQEATAEARRDFGWVDFDEVQLEAPIGSIRPDVVGYCREQPWIVEIRVSHAVDAEKIAMIRRFEIAAIEVQLDPETLSACDWPALEAAVIDAVDNKIWLHCPDEDLMAAEAGQRAREMADRLPPLPSPTGARTKVRYEIGGMFVNVTELPFGHSVWCSWHPQVSPLISRVAKGLGGRWKNQYRNWLVPKACGGELHRQLRELSSTDNGGN